MENVDNILSFTCMPLKNTLEKVIECKIIYILSKKHKHTKMLYLKDKYSIGRVHQIQDSKCLWVEERKEWGKGINEAKNNKAVVR